MSAWPHQYRVQLLCYGEQDGAPSYWQALTDALDHARRLVLEHMLVTKNNHGNRQCKAVVIQQDGKEYVHVATFYYTKLLGERTMLDQFQR